MFLLQVALLTFLTTLFTTAYFTAIGVRKP
mgnify:CR=1 FL=1|jgi:hypothetical protein